MIISYYFAHSFQFQKIYLFFDLKFDYISHIFNRDRECCLHCNFAIQNFSVSKFPGNQSQSSIWPETKSVYYLSTQYFLSTTILSPNKQQRLTDRQKKTKWRVNCCASGKASRAVDRRVRTRCARCSAICCSVRRTSSDWSSTSSTTGPWSPDSGLILVRLKIGGKHNYF